MSGESAKEFGEEFRCERELRDVSREQLAAATKVSVCHIQALEEGRFQKLPGAVFSRGFVRSISQHLGLDADRMAAAFRSVYEGWQAEEERRASAPLTPSARLRLSQPRRSIAASTTVRGLGVALLLALLTGLAALLKSHGGGPRRAASGPRGAERSQTGPASLALPPAIAAATVALPPEAGPPAAVPAVAPVRVAQGGHGESTLSLSFKEDCWAEILVDGHLVVKGLFRKGTKREVSGGRTFTLTLGNAGVVEVAVDGRAIEPLGEPGKVVRNFVIEGARQKG